MILLIDADIVCFRAAFTAEDEEEAWVACARADQMLQDMLAETKCTEYELWLSGEGNFRYDVFPEYKAHRITAKRPKWEKEVKNYFVRSWDANWSTGCEADDMLGVRQMELATAHDNEEGCTVEFNSMIGTIDKDLNMIPGWHYNFVKKEKSYVDKDAAFRFFCYQLLVGDTADGIKGVPGIGPKKADRLLDSLEKEEWLDAIKDLYGSEEEMLMNGKCLWIWRKKGDIWTGPTHDVNPS